MMLPKNKAQESQAASAPNSISKRRVWRIIITVLLFIAGNVYVAYHIGMLTDDMLCLSAVSCAFILVFLIALLKNRLNGELIAGSATKYSSICAVLSISWVLVGVFIHSTTSYAPVLSIAVLLTTALSDVMALATSIYFIFVICIAQGSSIYICFSYSLLVIFGVLLSPYLKEKSWANKFCIHLIYFLLNVLFASVFYYEIFLEFKSDVFVYGIIMGLINCLILTIFYPLVYKGSTREEAKAYERLLSEDYILVRELRRFSTAEYNHALRVSRISAHCAELIGANVDAARCGGFYYRIGKLEGEPEIDNALRIANNHCFPTPVVAIISEYGGILSLPHSKESAIVHMIDSIVTKAEVFDSDTMSSTWNQDMIIYQTLNELSTNGYYDESTLSTNQFLKIRDFLVQKESLL